MGSAPRGLVEAHRVHGPLPGDSEAPRFASSSQPPLSSHAIAPIIRVLWVFTSRCPHGAWWEGIAVSSDSRDASFHVRWSSAGSYGTTFSRSVFTGEVTQEEAGSMAAMTREGREAILQLCRQRGGCLPGPAGGAAVTRHLPTHLPPPPGRLCRPVPSGRPPGPWVTEHEGPV